MFNFPSFTDLDPNHPFRLYHEATYSALLRDVQSFLQALTQTNARIDYMAGELDALKAAVSTAASDMGTAVTSMTAASDEMVLVADELKNMVTTGAIDPAALTALSDQLTKASEALTPAATTLDTSTTALKDADAAHNAAPPSPTLAGGGTTPTA